MTAHKLFLEGKHFLAGIFLVVGLFAFTPAQHSSPVTTHSEQVLTPSYKTSSVLVQYPTFQFTNVQNSSDFHVQREHHEYLHYCNRLVLTQLKELVELNDKVTTIRFDFIPYSPRGNTLIL